VDIAKCIALGADLVASARPVLVALHRGKQAGLRRMLDGWANELRGVMFLTGSPTLKDLRKAPLVRSHIS
jgi:isopentenyl-diphosphate delta-isomerase